MLLPHQISNHGILCILQEVRGKSISNLQHYFSVKTTLFWCSFNTKKIFFSNHNTKLHTKSYFIILYVFNFLFVIYLIVQFINKISE